MVVIAKLGNGNPSETLEFVNRTWEEFGTDYPFEYSWLKDDFGKLFETERRTGQILLVFSILSIFLSCLGLLGLASFMAESKTKEIGIRKVLGATVSKILIMLNREFIRCLLLANVIAWPIGWYFMNSWLQTYPYRTRIDLVLFIIAALLSGFITLFTTSIQALKAAYTNPVNALHYE